jgi:hypothetical protein
MAGYQFAYRGFSPEDLGQLIKRQGLNTITKIPALTAVSNITTL